MVKNPLISVNEEGEMISAQKFLAASFFNLEGGRFVSAISSMANNTDIYLRIDEVNFRGFDTVQALVFETKDRLRSFTSFKSAIF